MATEPILQPIAGIRRRDVARSGASASSSAEQLSALLSLAWMKKLLFLASDLLALVAAHALAEVLTRRWTHVPATFLNPPAYYLFYAPFFTAMLYLLSGYKSPDLRRPEKELELLFQRDPFCN